MAENEFVRICREWIDYTDQIVVEAQAPEPTLPIATIKESLVSLTQQERQDLYRTLHDSFGCRVNMIESWMDKHRGKRGLLSWIVFKVDLWALRRALRRLKI